MLGYCLFWWWVVCLLFLVMLPEEEQQLSGPVFLPEGVKEMNIPRHGRGKGKLGTSQLGTMQPSRREEVGVPSAGRFKEYVTGPVILILAVVE